MKPVQLFLVLLLSTFFFACGGKKNANSANTKSVKNQSKTQATFSCQSKKCLSGKEICVQVLDKNGVDYSQYDCVDSPDISSCSTDQSCRCMLEAAQKKFGAACEERLGIGCKGTFRQKNGKTTEDSATITCQALNILNKNKN